MLITIKSSPQANLQSNESSKITESNPTQLADWNVNTVLRTIFDYLSREDLIELSTTSKKWNYLLTPIIHSKLKMFRSRKIQNRVHNLSPNSYSITEAEIEQCIQFNSKYSHLIKDFTIDYEPEPSLSNIFFSTFTSITTLHIFNTYLNEDFFMCLANSLNNLKYLDLNKVNINEVFNNRYNSLQPVELATTLEKLSLHRILLTGDPQLFVELINSHSNLKEFYANSYLNPIFLNPFFKPYPTLKKFNYDDSSQDNIDKLINIIKLNSQLEGLGICSKHLNDIFVFVINKHLTELKELSLTKYNYSELNSANIDVEFNNYTNLTKLELNWNKLSQKSLNSILEKSQNLSYLSVTLPRNWKDWTQSIRVRCPRLKELKYETKYAMYSDSNLTNEDEFFSTEFASNIHYACSNCLYQLTFINFNLGSVLKEDHFANFPSLKRVKLITNKYLNRLNTNSIDSNLKNWEKFCSLKYSKDNDYLEYRLNKI